MITYSIIQKSQLEGALRLDAEYYQPEYLEVIKKLKNTKKVGDLVSDIRYGLYSEPEYLEKGIDFIRALNLLNFWIDGEVLKIDEKKVSPNYKLKVGDLLIVRSGANTGCVGIIYPKFKGATFGSYTIRLRFNKVNPFFAAIFLNTKYGFLQTKRWQTGMAQPNLNIPNIKEIKIPIISESRQKEIEKLCWKIKKKREQSETLYFQAENLLLEELGLKDFKVEEDLSYIVNLSEVKSAHRADAEYFQPKYEKIISNLKCQMAKLGDLVSIKKGIEIGSEQYQEEGKLFLRVSNLSKQGLIEKNQKYLSEELYQKLKKDFEPKIGEILLTKDATPGIAYVLKESIEGIIASGILRLKLISDIEPEYLALVINSVIGQIQVERDTGGSVIVHWRPDQIKNCLIPLLPKSTQQKIADLVRQSHQACQKAKQLLEEAKNKVEALIDKK
ncbi:restriction endonuclease subunit S [Peptococcaceae bacterium]|nr:restriction endonuclease subunit S [Peptococcaceae bacterium]